MSVGGISITETFELIWQSLGVFRYLFALALFAILVFLSKGWRMLARATCPVQFDNHLAAATRGLLRELVDKGMSAEEVKQRFYGGHARAEQNLYFGYLCRFGARDRSQPLPPSLMEMSDELYQLHRIQNVSYTARFLAAVLPAIGLLGTLIGMFNAFFAADFAKGQELATTMQGLMQNFSLALFTTIAAVVLKIGVDLFNHFTVEVYVERTRGDLLRLRGVLQDLLVGTHGEASAPEPQAIADEVDNAAADVDLLPDGPMPEVAGT